VTAEYSKPSFTAPATVRADRNDNWLKKNGRKRPVVEVVDTVLRVSSGWYLSEGAEGQVELIWLAGVVIDRKWCAGIRSTRTEANRNMVLAIAGTNHTLQTR